MRYPLPPLLALMLATLPVAASAQQKVDIRARAIPAVSVRLGGAIGGVKVIGWDRDSIALTGALAPGSRMDGGPIRNNNDLVVGMKFFVNAVDESAVLGNKLELRVPAQARVWIKAGSAEVDASGVTGGLDLNIVGGSVTVRGAPRELIIEAMDGKVTVNATPEYARLKTATGDIVMQGGGEDVSASTVSGSIRAADGTFQRGRFESVTGPIVFAGDFTRGGEARFDSHSGAIELRLGRNAPVEIDAASVTGSIENGWTKTRPAVGREGRGMELGISSGMGAAHVSIRSFKGNVRLSAK